MMKLSENMYNLIPKTKVDYYNDKQLYFNISESFSERFRDLIENIKVPAHTIYLIVGINSLGPRYLLYTIII
jgi:hypothetical protein